MPAPLSREHAWPGWGEGVMEGRILFKTGANSFPGYRPIFQGAYGPAHLADGYMAAVVAEVESPPRQLRGHGGGGAGRRQPRRRHAFERAHNDLGTGGKGKGRRRARGPQKRRTSSSMAASSESNSARGKSRPCRVRKACCVRRHSGIEREGGGPPDAPPSSTGSPPLSSMAQRIFARVVRRPRGRGGARECVGEDLLRNAAYAIIAL